MPGVGGTMKEFAAGTLHSGAKQGPLVTSKKQALAIGLAQAGKSKPRPKPAKPMTDDETRAQRVKDFEEAHGDAEI